LFTGPALLSHKVLPAHLLQGWPACFCHPKDILEKSSALRSQWRAESQRNHLRDPRGLALFAEAFAHSAFFLRMALSVVLLPTKTKTPKNIFLNVAKREQFLKTCYSEKSGVSHVKMAMEVEGTFYRKGFSTFPSRFSEILLDPSVYQRIHSIECQVNVPHLW
jgi:hypothetical protein